MAYEPDTLRYTRSTGTQDLGLAVKVHNLDTDPTAFINVRLTNGATFYTATGGSGTASEVQADQGSPALLSSAWPMKITDGTSVLGTLGAPLSVLLASGSDPVGTATHPIWVTGSVYVLDPGGGAGSNVTALSGSVAGLLVGGNPLGTGNPLPVTGTITVAGTVAITNPQTTTTVLSGSVSGLLLGGQPVSLANPLPITGSLSLSQVAAITGSVVLASSPSVTVLSGSVTGLLYGGVPAGQTNPLWVTGSVQVLNPGGAGSNVTALSGSVVGLLVGGNPLSLADPVPVTGSVSISQAIAISSIPTVTVTGSVSLASSPSVTVLSGSITALQVGGAMVSSTNPVWVTGSVQVLNPGGAGSNVTALSGSVAGLLVGGQPLNLANPVPVTGTVSLSSVSAVTGSISLASAPTVFASSGSVTGLLVGGQPVSSANPLPVGSHVINSGSVTGLLIGGNPLAGTNPLPVTGTVSLASVSAITGSITLAAVGAITGSVVLASAPTVLVASGSVTGLLLGGQPVSLANAIPIAAQDTSTVSVTSLTASVTSQQLIAANSNRIGLAIYNDSTVSAFMKFGGSAASNNFSIKLIAADYYETPFAYVGSLHIVWTSATGSARVTEFTL